MQLFWSSFKSFIMQKHLMVFGLGVLSYHIWTGWVHLDENHIWIYILSGCFPFILYGFLVPALVHDGLCLIIIHGLDVLLCAFVINRLTLLNLGVKIPLPFVCVCFCWGLYVKFEKIYFMVPAFQIWGLAAFVFTNFELLNWCKIISI